MNNNSPFHNPMAEQIWDMKYRLKEQDGTPIDDSVQDTWLRVAKDLASVEIGSTAHWLREFYNILENFSFIPAGRINAGAGSGRNVTLFNCFVMGTIPDSLSGIFDMIKEAALTMQAGGGIGYDFSTIRPMGADVLGVAADASGPLSFMDVWDAMCKTIMSAGTRRGAMMATMRVDHPDIEKFIEAKRDPTRLRMFNLSVLITDKFMQAVSDNADFDLVFNGKVYKTIKARALWDKIAIATYEYAEPGVIFIDRINKMNNLNYCETIAATNPCLTGDTLVSTASGMIDLSSVVVGDLIKTVDGMRPVTTIEVHEDTQVYEVSLSDGAVLKATAAHIFHVADGKYFSSNTRLDALSVGDSIRLSPSELVNEVDIDTPNDISQFDFGLLVGAMIGDGSYTPRGKTVKYVSGVNERDWITKLSEVASKAGDIQKIARCTDSTLQFCSTPLMHFFDNKTDIERAKSPNKTLPMSMLNSNKDFLSGYIDGLISTDGNINMNKSNPCVRVASSSKQSLMMLKRAMSFFGILARVYVESGKKKGMSTEILGRTVTRSADGYVLVVLGDGVKKLYDAVKLTHPEKRDRLRDLVVNYSLTGCTWKAEIKSIKKAGKETVYDLFEEVTDTWVTDGVVSRGCGEQPLPPYGACLLGSINLAAHLNADYSLDYTKLAHTVRVSVRMLDNVIDVSKFPLPEQEKEAKDKRRIGLGTTGVADAMALGGVVYGTGEGASWVDSVNKFIAVEAYLASIDLAKEKGSFPLLDVDKYLAGDNMQGMPDEVRDGVREHGIRNALLTSIAPTGTISLYAGNVSSGIEPIFAFEYERKVTQKDGSKVTELVRDYAVDKWRRDNPNTTLPASFVSAQTLTPLEHVKMQAAAQRWIDSSISKTINCPVDISFDDFKEVYMSAWELGCKGCTTYRPNAITGSVLSVPDKPDEGGACELKYDESTGQLIKSCE